MKLVTENAGNRVPPHASVDHTYCIRQSTARRLRIAGIICHVENPRRYSCSRTMNRNIATIIIVIVIIIFIIIVVIFIIIIVVIIIIVIVLSRLQPFIYFLVEVSEGQHNA